MSEFALIFDIPTGMNVFKVKLNRSLKLIGARMVQRSVWKSENLNEMVKLALWIRQHGGKAEVVEWRPLVRL